MKGPTQRWWCGEDHARHKLMEDEVLQIREMTRKGLLTLREIGRMFGVHKATVFDIKQGRTWKHLWE